MTVEVWVLHGVVDSCLPTFQESLPARSSKVKQSKTLIIKEGTNRLCRNVGKNYQPTLRKNPAK
jgi:hypothetical protein